MNVLRCVAAIVGGFVVWGLVLAVLIPLVGPRLSALAVWGILGGSVVIVWLAINRLTGKR